MASVEQVEYLYYLYANMTLSTDAPNSTEGISPLRQEAKRHVVYRGRIHFIWCIVQTNHLVQAAELPRWGATIPLIHSKCRPLL